MSRGTAVHGEPCPPNYLGVVDFTLRAISTFLFLHIKKAANKISKFISDGVETIMSVTFFLDM